jgi:hypothetical protein
MKIVFVVLLILTVLLILPPIIHGYIYPDSGDDSGVHLNYFRNMDLHPPLTLSYLIKMQGNSPLYWGEWIVGKLINLLPFNKPITYVYFEYFCIILATWVIGITVTKTVNQFAGIVASILGSFGSIALIDMLWCGIIFDLIGIAIILPLLVFYWYKTKKNPYWLFVLIPLSCLFIVFHKNGLAFIPLMLIIVAHELVVRKYKSKLPDILKNSYIVPIAGLIIAYFIGYKLNIISHNSERLLGDALVLLPIVVAGLVGSIRFLNKKTLRYGVALIVIVFALPNLISWMQYNSAVKQVDKLAIQYLNGLGDKTYALSPESSNDIFSLYTGKEYVNEGRADYYIYRSVPMTNHCDPTFFEYKNKDYITFPDYVDSNKALKRVCMLDCGEKDNKGNSITIDIFKGD